MLHCDRQSRWGGRYCSACAILRHEVKTKGDVQVCGFSRKSRTKSLGNI